MTKMIAFGHEKNVGKDTAARFLTTHLRMKRKGSNIQKHGFADKLKDQCYQLYSWAGLMPGAWYDEPENRTLKEVALPLIGKSPRRIWIDYGQAVRANVLDTTWIDYIHYTYRCDLIIISDLRFPMEADRILQLGGLLFKINRPDIPHTSDEADDPLLEYKRWTANIPNDGSLNLFYERVINICMEYLSDG